MENASEFVTTRNASSSPKSAPDHGAATAVDGVDEDGGDDDDEGGGDGGDERGDDDVRGAGVEPCWAIVVVVVPCGVESINDVLDGSPRHAASSPPTRHRPWRA